MFGQQANTTPFGAAPSTPFGAPAAPGGFGAPASTPFGAAAPAPSFGGFGAAPAPATGFGAAPAPGGFGAPAPAAPGGFGAPAAPGGFGAPAATPAFGAPAAPSAFGAPTTSPFGAPAPATGGMFGTPAPAPSGGLFGTPAPAPGGFGAPAAPGGFGGFGATPASAPAPAFGAPSAFGAPTPAPSGSLFGAPAPAPSGGLFGAPAAPAPTGAFGAPAPAGGLFGAPAPAPAGGLFGSPPAAAAAGGSGGTRVQPWAITNKTDGSTQINLHAISAMPIYENKQAEELRVEDYLQGNKGSAGQSPAPAAPGGFGAPAAGGFGAAPAPSGGLFGAPAPSGGLFGSAAPAPGGFGASAPAPFGAPAPSTGFGATPAAPAPLFGAPAPAPGGFGGTSAFGATSAPAPAGGLFGAPAPAPSGGLFGSSATPAPAPAGGLFGAPAPAPAGGLFGAPAPAPSGGLFGAPAPAPTSAFGAPAPGGLFGAPAPAPGGGLFGAPAPAPGGLFGSPAPAPAFGAPAPGGGLFGAPAPAPGASLFGSKPAGGGLFGAPAPAPFGAPAPPPATGFGFGGAPAPQAQQPLAGYPPTANIIPPSQDALLAQQLAALENQKKEMESLDVWRGRSPQSSSITPTSQSEADTVLRVSPYNASTMGLISARSSPKSAAKIRPRAFTSATKPPAMSSVNGRASGAPMMSPDAYLGSTTKRLVIKAGIHTSRPRLLLKDLPHEEEEEKKEAAREEVLHLPATTPPLRASHRPSPPVAGMGSPVGVTSPPADSPAATTAAAAAPPPSARKQPEETRPTAPVTNAGYDFYQQITSPPAAARKEMIPRLTKADYKVMPSLEDLSKLSEADLAAVAGFTVTRPGFASVTWEGAVDVRGVDLDAVVCIEHRDVAVYDSDEVQGTKPPRGQKLNRPATITLHSVFPKEGAEASDEAKEKFLKKIKKTTERMGAEFISYSASTGVWTFRVLHFSRYGLLDDDSDDEEEEAMETEPIKASNFESGESGGHSPGTGGSAKAEPKRTKKLRFSDDVVFGKGDDDSADTLMSDVAEETILQTAANAYTAMADSASEMDSQITHEPEEKEQKAETFFQEENVEYGDFTKTDLCPPSDKDFLLRSRPGISAIIARRCGVSRPTDSKVDLGLRLGRSFRVGWRPDGSFVHLQQGPRGSATCLQQSSPVFTEGNYNEQVPAALLETHLKHSKKSESSLNCPSFSLSNNKSTGRQRPQSELINALADFENTSKALPASRSDDPEACLTINRAFSLMSCLLKQDLLSKSGSEELALRDSTAETAMQTALRQQSGVEACRTWLVAACAHDVNKLVREALWRNDVHSAIFAALTGGDLEQAASIAMKHGHSHLAILISSGAPGASFLRDQVKRWISSGATQHIPSELVRIYTLLGGDMRIEEEAYARSEKQGATAELDWRRRLCSHLSYGEHSEKQPSLSSFMEKYDTDVVNAVAPYPSPRYTNLTHKTPEGTKSVLYKIMELTKGKQEHQRMAVIVAPAGITSSKIDFSGTFHLAAALSALCCCEPLTPFEEARTVSSYAAQLSKAGSWEWGVYVLLCLLSETSADQLAWRERQAKELVMRHFSSPSDPLLVGKRSFLEDRLGVPSAWFEEALAYRSAHAGDAVAYVKHLTAFSPEKARMALEELVIPNLLFQSSEDIIQNMDLLELFALEDKSLAATMVDFIQLAQGVIALSQSGEEAEKEFLQELSETAVSVEDRLVAYRAQMSKQVDTTCGLRVVPTYNVVPPLAFVAEALSGISFLKLQLQALEEGYSVFSETSGFLVPSQLAFLLAKIGQPPSGSAESILPGLI